MKKYKKEFLALVCFWADGDDHYTGYTVVGQVYKSRPAAVKAARGSDPGTAPGVTEVPRGTFAGLLDGRTVLKFPKGYDKVPKRDIKV